MNVVLGFVFFLSLRSAGHSQSTRDWVDWLIALRQNQSQPPTRPDQLKPGAELPLWVECHLSFMLDDPRWKALYPSTQGLVLARSRAACANSPERRIGF